MARKLARIGAGFREDSSMMGLTDPSMRVKVD